MSIWNLECVSFISHSLLLLCYDKFLYDTYKKLQRYVAMETCEILKKPLLKKSELSVIKKKEKRVSFCSTVKVFIEELSSDQENVIDYKKNCIEVNIVDKSSDDSVNSSDLSKSYDCNATDFLVHKVVYENNIEHEDDADTDAVSEDVEEIPLMFEANTEDEGLHFVVHKVTDHEDDLIQQELELDDDSNSSFSEELECDSDIIGKLSELSIENILAHDKIIAFIDQNTLGLSSLLKSHLNTPEVPVTPVKEGNTKSTVSSSLKGSELILSPPLQELGLDQIVKAQSDNVLCELDISPLNSILETDSDSDASSEGTMIMMTTEESEKNEQHIRESFQKYESMKKEKIQTKETSIFELENNENKIEEPVKLSVSYSDVSYQETLYTNSVHYNVEKVCKEVIPVVQMVEEEEPAEKFEPLKKTGCPMKHVIQASCEEDFNNFDLEARKNNFLCVNNLNSTHYLDKSLESIEIPKDVREWKITPSSPKKNMKLAPLHSISNVNSATPGERKCLPLKANMHSSCVYEMPKTSPSPKSDELESFVLASKERVQRIRKRYSGKTKIRTGDSPVRGIRPRFGSTAEILQLMQKQNQPPFYTFSNRSHVSWPCNEAISNPEINVHYRKESKRKYSSQSLPNDYSSHSSISSYGSEESSCSNCDQDSVSSCPSMFFHERGVPEGCSPPRSFTEDCVEQYSEENPNNIVYFSMKV